MEEVSVEAGSSADQISVEIPAKAGAASPLQVTTGIHELVLKGEDAHGWRENVIVGGETLCLGLVADGHGGKACSQMLKAFIFDSMLELLELPPSGAALQKAGTKAFLASHRKMVESGKLDGSTLTLCVVNVTRGELTTLHAGDSVARLVGRRTAAMALCEDHRIESSQAERDRLIALGGTIARAMDKHGRPGGPLRLWPKGGPGVAQARAIGDADVAPFIEPTPHAQTVTLPVAESCCVVMCSDGVWDAMSPQDVDAVVRNTMILPAGTIARQVTFAALSSRHAYSNEGDEMPIDDTTVLILRIEDEEDVLSAKTDDLCAHCKGP